MSPSRRRLLVGLSAGVAASIGGCGSSPPGDSSAGIDVADSAAVGTAFTVRLSEDLAGTVDRVHLSVEDSRGATFEGELPTGSDGSGRRVPVERLRETPTPAYVTRSDASSGIRISTGVGGDGPLRMLAHHLDSPDGSGPPRFVPAEEPLAPDAADGGYEVTVEAIREGESAASTSTRRVLADPDLADRSIPAEDLVGRVTGPPGDAPAPGIVVLHGSGSTDLDSYSRMLATHGYAVLTLKYFGESGLPETLDDIPLEYFDRAVEWFTGREDVRGDRLGFVGLSRGVEAALLSAAAFDGSATVVGYGGSGIVHPGLTEVYSLDRETPPQSELGDAGWEAAWTRGGEPVASGDEIRSAYSHVGALDLEELRPVGIDVEAIDGPVLLLTGRDDALWQAPVFSEYAVRRLSARGSAHAYAHVVYEGAGHLFLWPYRDYDGVLTADYLGGSPSANARAAADAWVRTLDYLEAGLRSGDEGRNS